MATPQTIDKQRLKDAFAIALGRFAGEMERFVATNEGDWTIKGFIDVEKNVYTVSLDTKIVSKVLELHLFPQLQRFAQLERYGIVLAEHQNWYPDISFVSLTNPSVKFAVDVKTTYRDPRYVGHVNGFTLGSHGAYFRNRESTKNIQFPYGEYLGHYCLGVIYSRAEDVTETAPVRVRELEPNHALSEAPNVVDDLRSITSVIRDFRFFAREKWRIASDRQGSGNTANIGSITDIDDIVSGRGIFSRLGEDWFDQYWMNYGSANMKRGREVKPIKRLTDFVAFRGGDDTLIVPIKKKSKKGEEKRSG